MAQKRKASELSGQEPDQAQKVRVVEQTADAEKSSSKSRGEKRQEKSERRTKKGKKIHTREAAIERNRKVQEKKRERKEQQRLARTRAVPTSAPNTNSASSNKDDLAAGSDFVPLFTEDVNPTPVDLGSGAPLQNGQKATVVLEPKRSKKGLTKADRKAKAEANRLEQKARTAKRKEKKLRKASVINPNPVSEEDALLLPPATTATATAIDEPTSTPSKRPRFILFIGNLPFTTTTPSLEQHFSSLAPFTVRHNTDKTTKKSKGFAFLEFEHYDKMKTCLKLYHHSYFNPENPGSVPISEEEDGAKSQNGGSNGQKDKGRRINVELTAGGGGKGKDRKDKIDKKNEKLAQQRERRLKKEKAEKGEKSEQQPVVKTGANADDRGDIHPSRMSRVKGH